MKKHSFRSLAFGLALTCGLMGLTGCGTSSSAVQGTASQPTQQTSAAAPKYVFLFIGDGMSYPQFQAASYYLGAKENTGDIVTGGKNLSFMNFDVAGSANTFDSTSFCPDSASTATSIATGYKTHSGVINMDESKTTAYTAISEQLRDKGYKIGIVSSVNLNHATPAAFYAHQASRNNYYEIGQELIASGFDYFAGGGLKQTTGKDKDKTDLYQLAADAGYQVITTAAQAEALGAADGKAILIGETLADSDSLSYDNDRIAGEWSLADYVSKGIEVLENDTGFFMMVEGGKIDWACHANDAGSTIADTLAMADAVDEAIAFYNDHPTETLILVTGDHETGGMTIGYAGTNYDTYLTNLENQSISYARFDEEYVASYIENQTPFADAMSDVEQLFGLTMPENAAGAAAETLVLTDYEVSRLQAAYAVTLEGGVGEDATQEDYLLYGGYEPFSVTVTHLLNNKSGIAFTSYSHTGLPVAVFAQGAGSELFAGSYDNTAIYDKLAQLCGI